MFHLCLFIPYFVLSHLLIKQMKTINMKTKIKLKLKHGIVTCHCYKTETENSPIVIITNGSNGFYNYGMFPFIQEDLYKNGISSISYNFSHGGVEGDQDYFTQLDLYEKNCMRLEVEDLYGIITNIYNHPFNFKISQKIILMAHSLGGIPTIFAAKRILSENISVDGIILLASVSTLDLYSKEILDNWEKDNVWLVKNNRTNQMLPRGYEFLCEVKNAQTLQWNLKEAIKQVNTEYLIIHGAKDDSVDIKHSINIKEWAESNLWPVSFNVIENATHTFNTKHPFEGETIELKNMLSVVVNWIKK